MIVFVLKHGHVIGPLLGLLGVGLLKLRDAGEKVGRLTDKAVPPNDPAVRWAVGRASVPQRGGEQS